MTKDYVYIFDKTTKEKKLLGEIQANFNMSLVIDGTKDSLSLIVLSYKEINIEPYTILFHDKTQTYWCVSHDKVERYANESGFLYMHHLELLGAVELLNARDLTDCGFNDNTYTIAQILDRLIKLSNFEYPILFDYGINNQFLAQKVYFIKTFQNYTLLSALREFLDAYNMSVKLSFNTFEVGNKVLLNYAIINIIPKTGDYNLEQHNIDDFDDIKETRTIDENSFGSCVVSNAENVISNNPKTYPVTGGVKTTSHEYNIIANNAVIRLPSNVFKGNWLSLITSQAFVEATGNVGSQIFDFSKTELRINALSKNSFDAAIDRILQNIESLDSLEYSGTPQGTGVFYNPCREALLSSKDKIFETIKKVSTIKLYDGNEINPVTGAIVKGENVPYIVYVDYHSKDSSNKPLIFCDKDTKNMLPSSWQGIAWERGSNEITGFDGFEPITGMNATIVIRNLKYTELQVDKELVAYGSPSGNDTYIIFSFSNQYGDLLIRTPISGSYNIHFRTHAQWVVNYIPMSDIKIKVDNTRDKNDIKLYNQTGKITDSFALSKLINSYSKEISSDTITKFKNYVNINDVPKIGSIVKNNSNEHYVINNISLTFTQNETSINDDFGYYIEGEFTMSKYIAAKSLMVNPDTNIRDYGIPQNYNVKRKQLYRDFYEINYIQNSSAEQNNYYIDPQKIFTFGHEPRTTLDLAALMKIDYEIPINEGTTYYYQLETTNYDLNKMFYIMLDFNDNNIIGYGNQNVYSGFVISRIFSGQIDALNTPISYVDENGNFKDIDIRFVDNKQLTQIYDDYVESNSGESGYATFLNSGRTIYNANVFIPQDVFDGAKNNKIFEIEELNYNKDALEVPVFEYSCQVDDTNDVLIGDNILKQYSDDYVYFYSYEVGDNLTQDNAYTNIRVGETTSAPLGYRILQSAILEYSKFGDNIRLRILTALYSFLSIDGEWSEGNYSNIIPNKDYAIFRHAYNRKTGEEIVDLLFIAKKVPQSALIGNYTISLEINHYKLN